MPSLLNAIETKYDINSEEFENIGQIEFVIFVPKVDRRKHIQRVLVLDKCEIDSVGDEEALKDVLSSLEELDLAYNHLTKWTDIWKILRCSPCLTILNLSFNDLSSKDFFPESRHVVLNNLSVLILIGTKAAWKFVHYILSCSANLKELHLSKNKIDNVDFDCNGKIFTKVTKLMFDENHINRWEEIQKLGQMFPNLVHLGLSDCLFSEIPKNTYKYFENLESISVSNTRLKEMTDVVNISLFPSLTELRIQGTLIFTDLTDHERRQLFVALLPNIKKLNGGATISSGERECSERAFIRYFMKDEPKPKRYHELIGIHGELQPLADVKLNPQIRVNIRFTLDEIVIENQIYVYQTVKELKTYLETLFGIQPSRMRLYYVDIGLEGHEEMRFPDKLLFSYNLRDNDEIRIVLKDANGSRPK